MLSRSGFNGEIAGDRVTLSSSAFGLDARRGITWMVAANWESAELTKQSPSFYPPSFSVPTLTAEMFRSALTKTVLDVARPSMSKSMLRPLAARGYHENVISHYEKPRNVGSLPKGDVDVGTGLVGAPACGDVMKLQIRVNEDGIISDVKFKTFGCGSAIASSSYMTERVKGLSLEEAGKIKNTEIAKELCLPPVKLHCSMLAEDAIRSAIRDYQSKRTTTSKPKQKGFIDVSQNTTTGETVATAHPGQT
ncbi:Iron sulfur cluster assembly protein 1, mitochondrial [Hypsizygus marmoreus]|uniref:Iron-sulfur cluster assembly protein n=1 Tax=Hypsizygus marmoreus TaxID=39966 RepID=A0A369JV40_HYPMA|nr:Iron sulfur cluster assembly protein 1, mitochondrial [Hypsizygus marmoreus]